VTGQRVTSSSSPLRTSSAATTLVVVALLASGCGTTSSSADRGPSGTGSTRAPQWTFAEADTELDTAVKGFSADLDELYRQRNEQHDVAVYAVQCDELVPELTDFLAFLAGGRWPAPAQPAVDDLVAAQTTYNKGLRVCADALDEKHLLAGFRQMDTAPVDTLVTRLRTELSSGAT
jgi:hypothetical protein